MRAQAPPLAEGLRLAGVAAGAELGGVERNDLILSIDGLAARDAIDLQFELPGARTMTIRKSAGPCLTVALQEGSGAVGALSLADPMPGGVRTCNNHCEFCFIRGLPAGLRSTLYVFDDDFRYAFLWGNFLTLTNLSEADWHRVGFQRLSPLNVSVHATDPDIRGGMLSNRRAPAILPQLRRLGGMGVRVNTQIVLCPGINDGAILEQSLADLTDLYPNVQSISVVPVGLTRYSRVRSIRSVGPRDAEAALVACEGWHSQMRARVGRGVVYASDELYLLAGRKELPPSSWYDDFPVLTNGIGMIRSMLDDWSRRLRGKRHFPPARRMTWLAGRLAAPALERMAEAWGARADWRPQVRVVTNHLFGDSVAASGLLSGADLIAALQELPADVDDIVLPRSAFGFDGTRTLDGVSAQTVGDGHRGRVHLATTPAELMEILTA